MQDSGFYKSLSFFFLFRTEPVFLMNSPDPAIRQWFVMRDLKRRNAKHPAYRMFEELHVECFTPMVEALSVVNGHRIRRVVPFMQDLLFVRNTRKAMDFIVDSTPTLQYRYVLGLRHTPMVVRDAEMDRFIRAVRASQSIRYYTPQEVTPSMRSRRIRIIGGPLHGYEGSLVTVRGSKVRRLLVEIPSLLAATVEVEPEYIQLM